MEPLKIYREVVLIEILEWDFRLRMEAALKKVRKVPTGNQVILLRSRMGNQLAFIYETVKVTNKVGDLRKVHHTERLVLAGSSTWSALMLQEYAHEVGIHFTGLKTFAQRLQQITGRVERLLEVGIVQALKKEGP